MRNKTWISAAKKQLMLIAAIGASASNAREDIPTAATICISGPMVPRSAVNVSVRLAAPIIGREKEQHKCRGRLRVLVPPIPSMQMT